MTELIHFKAPGGHIIAMTLPLHPTIEQQWEHGDLQRVNEDGSSWDGSAVEVPEEVDGPEDPVEVDVPEAPARPKATANKSEWQDFAVALGAATAEEAASMTKAQLVDLTTPGEMQPPVPEV